jgi:hypothetical protein
VQGKCATQEYDEAARWARASAGGGIEWSAMLLGRLYGEGLGVEQDFFMAILWMEVGNKGSTEDQTVLSPEEHERAVRSARKMREEFQAVRQRERHCCPCP